MALYGPVIVLLHELGHALFAGLGGYRVTSFGVGLGRPVWSITLNRGIVFHIDRWVLAGGACTAIPIGPPGARRAWFHAGGLIVQAILAVVLLLGPDAWPLDRIALFNVLVALTNALPWRVGGHASDGWWLWDAATGGRRGGNLLLQRPIFEHLAAREALVGSPLGRAYAELCLAWVDTVAGRTEQAGEFFRADPPETALDPWVDSLFHYVRAGWHRQEGRPLAALRTVREARATLDHTSADESLGLLALAEARALIDLDSPDRAKQALARIAGVGGPIGRQAAAILLGATLGDATDDLELATWRVGRRIEEPWLDPADPVRALWAAADELESRGRLPAARGARAAATTLASRVLDSVLEDDEAFVVSRLGEAAGALGHKVAVG